MTSQPPDGATEPTPALLAREITWLTETFEKSALPAGPVELRNAFEASLEVVATLVLATWIPSYDERAVLSLLLEGDDASLPEAPKYSPGAYPVIDNAALAALARRSLSSERLATLQAGVAKERADWEIAARKLKAGRDALGLFERSSPEVVALEYEESRESHEAQAASENLQIELIAALGVFPPMQIRLAAQTLLGLTSASLPRVELLLDPLTGGVGRLGSLLPRAVIATALLRLRSAMDVAFPGALGDRGAGPAMGDRRGGRDEGASPFRARPQEESGEAPLAAPDLVEHLAGGLEATGVLAQLERCIAHGFMLGSISARAKRRRHDIKLVDRVAFWTDSDAELESKELAARRKWHDEVFARVAEDALQRVDRLAAPHFLTALRNQILRCYLALLALDTQLTTNHLSELCCPIPLRLPAIGALFELAAIVGGRWGLSGGKDELLHHVAAYLRNTRPGPSPFELLREHGRLPRPLSQHEVVVGTAEALRHSPLLSLMAQHDELRRRYEADSAGAIAAARSMSFWDDIEIFSRSPKKDAKVALEKSARLDWIGAMQVQLQLGALLEQGLFMYPPALVYYELTPVRQAFEAVRSEVRSTGMGNNKRYYCVLLGKNEALGALRGWTQRAIAVFGRMPSSGEIIERFTYKRLWAR